MFSSVTIASVKN